MKALACEPPERHGLTLCRWSSVALAKAVVAQHLLARVSPSTVRRWLARDALQPWRQQCWIFPATRRVRDQRRRETRRLAYLAAYDVHQATWFGRCGRTTGIVPFTAPVDQL